MGSKHSFDPTLEFRVLLTRGWERGQGACEGQRTGTDQEPGHCKRDHFVVSPKTSNVNTSEVNASPGCRHCPALERGELRPQRCRGLVLHISELPGPCAAYLVEPVGSKRPGDAAAGFLLEEAEGNLCHPVGWGPLGKVTGLSILLSPPPAEEVEAWSLPTVF